ncbi:MAG: PilZ domain-containing protein [Desulfarculus sp.]|nr:PilZ domain-containing protein [Desulfarculus sp.]
MTDNHREEREFFRTAASLMVFWGPDTLAGRQALALDSKLWEGHGEMEAAARKALEDEKAPEALRPVLSVMRWLDFKLDLILHQMRLREQAAHFPGRATTTDLSGSGFGVAEPLGVEVGSRVLVSLALPDEPSRPVTALGEVVRAGEADLAHGAASAVRFLDIAEIDRERLIRFTFNQQRRLLAQRNQGEQE